MRITELLKRESIELGVALSSKEDAIDKLTGLMEAGGRLHDRAGYKEGILAREALGSTAVGDGIAIPHAKVAAVKEPGLAAVTVPVMGTVLAMAAVMVTAAGIMVAIVAVVIAGEARALLGPSRQLRR